MWKLLQAPRSPFALKVRIVIYELGVADRVDFTVVDPWTEEDLRRLNPLCKVPVLIAPEGVFYDSPVICEYLNESFQGELLPLLPAPRYDALRLQALGDGLAEAVIRRFVEGLGTSTERKEAVIRRQEAAIGACVKEIEAKAESWHNVVTIGQIGVASALIYLDYRSPEIEWRSRAPNLTAWFNEFIRRPSVIAAGAPLLSPN